MFSLKGENATVLTSDSWASTRAVGFMAPLVPRVSHLSKNQGALEMINDKI